MPSLPAGTVTFLFTDIEASTSVLQRIGDAQYAEVLEEHRRLLRAALYEGNGQEVDTHGDAFLVAFPRASDALRTAVAAQRAFASHTWSECSSLRVRMGLHTGEPVSETGEYVGLDVHRAARICAAGHGGQILVSNTTRALVGDNLPQGVSLQDLGEHRLKDIEQPQHLFQVIALDLPTDFPPLRSLELPNNLPRQLTSFVGREREMAEVKRRLATTALLTLTGTGGMGKTRLALQVATDVLEEYRDGVWLVELAAVLDPALVPQAVALALAIREVPGHPLLETLVAYLQNKQVLLVLDNCEHLLAASRDLAIALLRTCPRVRILATSRERLGVPGETLWRVPSLSLPEAGHLPKPGGVVPCDAVRLFVDRAMSTAPDFSVTSENEASVVQVCQRLDGIPLAIELAAARVKVLAVKQIATRLDDRFRLLTGGSRSILPRHQTLRAAIDWSHDLLTEKERVLLRRLTAFAGGWTLEAGETVCAGESADAANILDVLTSLVDKSLVLAETQSGVARFRLLETIRQYTWDRLLEAGEATTIRRRHRDWYLQWVEQAEPALRGPHQGEWLERLEGEHGNLRAALEWCVESGEVAEGLRLTIAAWRFWATRFVREGRGWVEELLKRGEDIPASLRAKALMVVGNLAVNHRDYAAASIYLQESLTLQRVLQDHEGAALCLINLGLVAVRRGFNLPRARALFEECLTVSRTYGNTRGIALALGNLGELAMYQGNYAEARALLEESLEIQRSAGDRRAIAELLYDLGELGWRHGDEATGRRCIEESLAMRQELGDKRGIAWCFTMLGEMALRRQQYTVARRLLEDSLTMLQEWGDSLGIVIALTQIGALARHEASYDEARMSLMESLTTAHELLNPYRCAHSLEELARVAAAQTKTRRAARLFGAAETLREAIGTPLPPCDQGPHARDVAAVREAFGDTFATAWGEGRAMTLKQATDYALAIEAD